MDYEPVILLILSNSFLVFFVSLWLKVFSENPANQPLQILRLRKRQPHRMILAL